MGFLQPLALLGLAAASIPLILHFWRQRLPPLVNFPAVRYLTETTRQHSRTLKLHHLLLLILRTLLIVAVVMAAARPVVQRRVPGMSGLHPPTAIVLLLDNSLSAQTVRGGVPAIETFRSLAGGLFDDLTAADRLWLILSDGLPRRVTPVEARALVDSLQPWPRFLDLGRAVEEAQRILADDDLPNAEIHVLSDLQATAVTTASRQGATILVVDPGGDSPPNRGVGRVHVSEAVWRPGEGGVIVAVTGSGTAERAPVTVRLGASERRIVLGPGETAEIRLEAFEVGWVTGEVTLAPDELRGDDRAHFAVRVVPPVEVRVDSSAGTFVADAVTVLETAGRVRSGSDVAISTRLGGSGALIVPPEDPALVGSLNRSLSASGVDWRLEPGGLPGLVDSTDVPMMTGTEVFRRYRLVPTGPRRGGGVMASVAGEPWLVRADSVVILGSRVHDAWTDLPLRAGFIVALDYVLNRALRGDAPSLDASPGSIIRMPDRVDAIDGPLRRSVEAGAPVAAPGEPGVYFLRAGVDTVGTLTVHADVRESMLDQAPRSAVERAFGDRTRMVTADRYAVERLASSERADVTSVFLLLAVALAIAEFVVARWGQRPVPTDAA